MGKSGMDVILSLSGLRNFSDNYPDDNLERTFDFSYVSSIVFSLEEMYGFHYAQEIALQVGKAAFGDCLKNFGVLTGVQDLAFKVLPLQLKIRTGLPAAVKLINQLSDQVTTISENEFEYVMTVHQCPVCWGREDVNNPVCQLSVGLLQESLKWVSGGREFNVFESKCKAAGDVNCEFLIQKEPLS